MAYTAFGKTVKKRLIDMDKTQTWLCEQVREKTGMYFDDGYLSRICAGKAKATKMVNAISEILGISAPDDTA